MYQFKYIVLFRHKVYTCRPDSVDVQTDVCLCCLHSHKTGFVLLTMMLNLKYRTFLPVSTNRIVHIGYKITN